MIARRNTITINMQYFKVLCSFIYGTLSSTEPEELPTPEKRTWMPFKADIPAQIITGHKKTPSFRPVSNSVGQLPRSSYMTRLTNDEINKCQQLTSNLLQSSSSYHKTK